MNKTAIRILIPLLFTATLFCAKEQSAPVKTETGNVPAPNTVAVQVTLRISGAAHLASDANPPFVIFPNFTNEHVPHRLFIVATPDAVAPNGLPNQETQVDLDVIDPETQKPKVVAVYKWGDIPIGVAIDLVASGVNTGAIQKDIGDELNEKCPSGANEKSLHWLPRLWRVSKASGPFSLKPEFTANPADPNLVSARYDIPAGRLEPQLTDERRVFAFRTGDNPSNDDVVQAVAMSLSHVFTVDLPANDPVFVLKGKEFATGNPIELGRFKPFTGSNPPRIEIDVMNFPFDEFFKLHDTKSIEHFELHYRVVAGSPTIAKPVYTEENCRGPHKPLFECSPTH